MTPCPMPRGWTVKPPRDSGFYWVRARNHLGRAFLVELRRGVASPQQPPHRRLRVKQMGKAKDHFPEELPHLEYWPVPLTAPA